MDFVSDWMNSLQLIKQDICQENIFGNMMMITLTVLPFIYAWILPNDNEQKVWEKLMRVILRRPAINPYEKWTPPKDDMLLYYTSFYLYVLFSPFTHVVSQVYVHISHASKVDHYMEYKTRTLNVIKHLQEGQFVQFDEEELHKLKALQHRATQYVMYYCKVSYTNSQLLCSKFFAFFTPNTLLFLYLPFWGFRVNLALNPVKRPTQFWTANISG